MYIISSEKLAEDSVSIIKIEHNGKTLEINVGNLSDAYNNPFLFLNSYNQYKNQHFQNELFDIYENIYNTLNNVWETRQLYSSLKPLVTQLINKYDFADVLNYVKTHTNIIYPPDLTVNYVQRFDISSSENKTYLKTHYEELVTMAIILRSILPIWWTFVPKAKKAYGNTFKETQAFSLISDTNLYNMEEGPINRLKVYIKDLIPPSEDISGLIFSGSSYDELPEMLLSIVVVRRIVSVNLNYDPVSNNSIIKEIYKFITQKIRNNNSTKFGIIKPISVSSDVNSTEENKLSSIEALKKNPSHSSGYIALMTNVYSYPEKLLKSIDPTASLEVLDILLNVINKNINVGYVDIQTKLAQFILKNSVPAQSILHVNRIEYINALAVCQTVLWCRQHYVLAGYITAHPLSNNNEILLDSGPINRITKENLDSLNKLYPYTVKINNKSNKNKTDVKIDPPIIENITIILNALNSKQWFFTLPDEMLKEITTTRKRIFQPSGNIKNLIAKMIIDIETI